MELLIKNMVCRRCVDAVRAIMNSHGVVPLSVELGRVDLGEAVLTAEQLAAIDESLVEAGFERIDDAEAALVEKIKQGVLHHVRSEEECRLNLSDCLEKQTDMTYDTLSRVFSRHERRTIESYCGAQRVERVKELLSYGELTLAEIAWQTGYSSPAHMSRRFKEMTGMTPSAYRTERCSSRKPLTDV